MLYIILYRDIQIMKNTSARRNTLWSTLHTINLKDTKIIHLEVKYFAREFKEGLRISIMSRQILRVQCNFCKFITLLPSRT